LKSGEVKDKSKTSETIVNTYGTGRVCTIYTLGDVINGDRGGLKIYSESWMCRERKNNDRGTIAVIVFLLYFFILLFIAFLFMESRWQADKMVHKLNE